MNITLSELKSIIEAYSELSGVSIFNKEYNKINDNVIKLRKIVDSIAYRITDHNEDMQEPKSE